MKIQGGKAKRIWASCLLFVRMDSICNSIESEQEESGREGGEGEK